MQKNNGNVRNPYTQSGVPAYRTPGGKKRSNLPKFIRRVVFVVVVLAAAVGVIIGVRVLLGSSSKPVMINARPTDTMQALGDSVLYHDGTTLYCIGPNGSSKWAYSLGPSGSFYTNGSMVVAWNGMQLFVLNKDGQPIFTDNMTKPIRFARIGEAYVAVCMVGDGDEDLSSNIRVMTHTGSVMADIKQNNVYMLDMNFFYTRGQLLWVLGLDVGGSTPMSRLSTYEPGKLDTGAVELADDLVYMVYPHNNNLMVVDTSTIRTFNYKCVEQTDPAAVLVYGWQVRQVKTMGRNTYALLERMPSAATNDIFSEIRVVTNYASTGYRLPSPCFASGISDKGVYGFGTNVVFHAPYGTNVFKATYLNFQMTELLCMLDGGRAVVASGNEVFIIKLPT